VAHALRFDEQPVEFDRFGVVLAHGGESDRSVILVGGDADSTGLDLLERDRDRIPVRLELGAVLIPDQRRTPLQSLELRELVFARVP
jgi:hypothetical protein